MRYLGIDFDLKSRPALDPDFIPFGIWCEAYLKDAKQPVSIAVERNDGYITVRNTCIYGTEEMAQADYRYIERLVKFLLWSVGGFRVYVCGASSLAKRLQAAYAADGAFRKLPGSRFPEAYPLALP